MLNYLQAPRVSEMTNKRKAPAPSARELLAALSDRLAGAVTGEHEFHGQEKNVQYLLDMINR